jgi:hypothetical protein
MLTAGGGSHGHTGFAGMVGNVSSGVDGDQEMTSEPGGPSYLALRYIIRAA